MTTAFLPDWMRRVLDWISAAIPAVLLTLGGCATTPEPEIRTVTVNVPVAAQCVPKSVAAAPAYPDTDDALRSAPDAAARYLLLFAGRMLRAARLAELEPTVEGCRTP